METGMQNLGSGGEAKASPADRDAAETHLARPWNDGGVDQTGRGGTMDTAMAANADPGLLTGTGDAAGTAGTAGNTTIGSSTIGTASPQVGQGQTAAYGETAENAPAPTAGESSPG
jgi:hypothetical protein